MLMTVINDYSFDGEIITLQPGDTVRVGERSNPDGPFPNWVYCTSDKTGKSGWVPVGILEIEDEAATVGEAYTSEEMAVTTGDIVDTIRELNGWFLCRRVNDGKVAWVDKGNVAF